MWCPTHVPQYLLLYNQRHAGTLLQSRVDYRTVNIAQELLNNALLPLRTSKMALPPTYVDGFHDEQAVKKMTYSRLGNTDIQISKLGIGGGAFSGFYGDFQQRDVDETLEFGLKSGMNYIDTAPLYGAGRSETALGKALKAKNIPRESFYISTKVGRYKWGWDTLDYSKERTQRSVEESLERLGLSYVDIVIVHDVEFADEKQVLKETLPAMEEMKKKGKVRYIGVSGYPLTAIWNIVDKSSIKIDVIITYARDTLIDKELSYYIPKLNEKGVGVITASPTACQLLTNKGPESWHPSNEKSRQICKKAADYCKENNVELGTLAVSHALSSPNTAVCLVGMMNKEIMKNNLDLFCNGLSSQQQRVLEYLRKSIFNLDEDLNWEGVELEMYKKYLESIGKPADFLRI